MNSIQFDCIAVFACIRWTGIQALAQTLHVVRFEFMKADAGGKRSCSHGTHAAELWLNHTRANVAVLQLQPALHSIIDHLDRLIIDRTSGEPSVEQTSSHKVKFWGSVRYPG